MADGKDARGTHREAAKVATEVTKKSSGGGFANLTAIVALIFSGYSFYETVLKEDRLRLFVPPTIEFADPYNGPFDVFVIPVTIANLGARSGVALSFDLDVVNPETGETKRYYAAGVGDWRSAFEGNRTPFAPINIAGRSAETRQVMFWARAEEEIDRHIAVEGGVYEFRLTLNRATVDRAPPPFNSGDDAPVTLSFEMMIDGLDYRAFNNGGTLSFRRADYAPVASE